MVEYVDDVDKSDGYYTEKKKGILRNLKKVSNFETNSKPFLSFVRTRFRTILFFKTAKKGFRT